MKKLPIIRHIRWAINAWRVERHYNFYRLIGMLPLNRAMDEEVLLKIWKGEA